MFKVQKISRVQFTQGSQFSVALPFGGWGRVRLALVFVWDSAQREKFNFYFSRVFFYYWQSFHFGVGAGCWAIILCGLGSFLIFPNVLRA